MFPRLVIASTCAGFVAAQDPNPTDPLEALRDELREARRELAELAESCPPARTRSSGSFGVDLTTQYLFRGIPQEDRGAIAQPWFEWTLHLADGEGAVPGWDLLLGSWNSLHDGPTGGSGSAWYESDTYLGLTATVYERLRAHVRYTAYHSPNAMFATVQEASLGVSYADDWWLSGGLQPSVTFAFELAGQADGGAELGSVCELGLEPTQSLGQLGAWEFAASLPVKVGLSLDGYYEQPDGGGDDAFGYASCGLALAAILPVGDGWPSPWRIEASLVHVTLGDGNRDRNGGDRNELVGTIGLSASF